MPYHTTKKDRIMHIYSNSIVDGYLKDEFGKRGVCNKKPIRSFHVGWNDLPSNTQSLALVFVDHDAIPVCGFSWIHWTVANIDPSLNELPENASINMNLIEGVSSWASKLLHDDWRLSLEDAIGYGGCAPPDKDHRYSITMYAINTKLDLTRGFYLNELLRQIDGNILEQKTIEAIYRA